MLALWKTTTLQLIYPSVLPQLIIAHVSRLLHLRKNPAYWGTFT